MSSQLAFPKPRPKLLDKRKAQADLAKIDCRERKACRKRSGGRCEVLEVGPVYWFRCRLRATENHHLISGSGRRNRGKSIRSEYRLDVCRRCHQEITNHVLTPVDGTKQEHAATVRYERRR